MVPAQAARVGRRPQLRRSLRRRPRPRVGVAHRVFPPPDGAHRARPRPGRGLDDIAGEAGKSSVGGDIPGPPRRSLDGGRGAVLRAFQRSRRRRPAEPGGFRGWVLVPVAVPPEARLRRHRCLQHLERGALVLLVADGGTERVPRRRPRGGEDRWGAGVGVLVASCAPDHPPHARLRHRPPLPGRGSELLPGGTAHRGRSQLPWGHRASRLLREQTGLRLLQLR